MKYEKLEFFKLDEIDRKVLLWLLDHVPQKSVSAWIEYIAEEYKLHKAVFIDIEKLILEIKKEEFKLTHSK